MQLKQVDLVENYWKLSWFGLAIAGFTKRVKQAREKIMKISLGENSMAWNRKVFLLLGLLVFMLACSMSGSAQPTPAPTLSPVTQPPEVPTLASSPSPPSPPPSLDSPTDIPEQPVAAVHLVFPGETSGFGPLNYDVESVGTAPQNRAPFGDSYNLNLLERPFGQDMTYIPDLDIRTFSLTTGDLWHYVSIELIGSNPNNDLRIHYGVVLDTDKDGYGNFLVWATPPYTSEWTVGNVQVFADLNRDSAGLSPIKSDAPFPGDGYETLIFDINQGIGDDTDLAWVRLAKDNVVQFAFKKTLAGSQFMFGTIADAGLKSPGQMDYVDLFTEQQAGSPVRGNVHYPMQALFGVDTTCHAAFGFAATGFEPKVCPRIVPPTQKASPGSGDDATPGMGGCQPPPGGCTADAPHWWPDPHCACSSIPYNP
jgi:hypothetical protein